MIMLVVAIASFIIGVVTGWFYAVRSVPHMLAKMSPSEVDALADRVGELRDGSS
jgi:uncharacterized protein YneF (UPF0154 family)